MLPAPQRDLLEASGWGVPHPVQRSFLVYGPRDRDELEIVWRAVQWSYDFAVGSPTVAAPRHPQQGVTA
jgi:phospholipase/carboxylesterase